MTPLALVAGPLGHVPHVFELAPEAIHDLVEHPCAAPLAGTAHVGEVGAVPREVPSDHGGPLGRGQRTERAVPRERVVHDHVVGLGGGPHEPPRVTRDQAQPPVPLGPGLLEALVEEEELACQRGHGGVYLDHVNARLGHVRRQVLGQRVAAPAHHQHAQRRVGRAGARAHHALDHARHLAVVLARQLEAQVLGNVAAALEGAVDVEQTHGGVVEVLGVKDERDAELGATHHHVPPAQKPRHRGEERRARDGQHGEGDQDLSQGGLLAAGIATRRISRV